MVIIKIVIVLPIMRILIHIKKTNIGASNNPNNSAAAKNKNTTTSNINNMYIITCRIIILTVSLNNHM